MKSVIFGSDLRVMPMMMRDRERLYTLLWYKQNTLSLYIYVNVIKHVDITGAHHVEAASNVYIFYQGVPVYLYLYIYACVRMNTDFETCRHVCSYTMQTHTRVHFEMHV